MLGLSLTAPGEDLRLKAVDSIMRPGSAVPKVGAGTLKEEIVGSGDITNELPSELLAQVLSEMRELRGEVKELRGEVKDLRGEVKDLRGEVRKLDGKVQTLDGRVQALEDKVDARLKETRPVWENVLAQLAGLRKDMDQGFRNLGRKIDLLGKDVLQMRADVQEFDERLTRLEGR